MKKKKNVFSAAGRLLFILLILLSAYVFAMFQGGRVSWTIFYIIIPFLLYSILLFIYPMKDFRVERSAHGRSLQRGDVFKGTIRLKRSIPFPLLYTVAKEIWASDDMRKAAEGKAEQLFIFGFKRKKELTYEIERMPRGQHITAGVEVEISDFFGWIKKTVYIPLKDTVVVYPKTTNVHYVPFSTRYDRGAIISPFTLVKDTTVATGVREYQAGDRVSWIHWKSFARMGNLMTKEFEDRQSEDLLCILDTEMSPAFEDAVDFTASLIQEAFQSQTKISFLSIGETTESFPVIHSEEQLHRFMLHLSDVKATATSDMTAFAASPNLRPEGSIVMVTSEPDYSRIQEIRQTAAEHTAILCFVIVKAGKPIETNVKENIRLMEMKGITVKLIAKAQFSEAFRG